jgi:hypothetical protein
MLLHVEGTRCGAFGTTLIAAAAAAVPGYSSINPFSLLLLLFQDLLEFGAHPASEVFKVKLQHVSLGTGGLNGHSYTLMKVGHQSLATAATQTTDNVTAAAAAAAV